MGSPPQENAALVRAFLTDVIAGGDTDALGIFLAEEAVEHHPVVGDRPGDEPVSLGRWRGVAAADVDIAIDDVVAAEDRVAVRGSVTGIHRESLRDLVPTGCSFEIAFAWFCRVDNGRIVEVWSLPNGPELVWQLNAIPGGPELITTHLTDQTKP